MVAVLMMSARLATLGLLKIKVFWNKGYNVIISVHDVAIKTLSRVSNFGNSGISKKEIIILSIL